MGEKIWVLGYLWAAGDKLGLEDTLIDGNLDGLLLFDILLDVDVDALVLAEALGLFAVHNLLYYFFFFKMFIYFKYCPNFS